MEEARRQEAEQVKVEVPAAVEEVRLLDLTSTDALACK
jgi:hypothetical protein